MVKFLNATVYKQDAKNNRYCVMQNNNKGAITNWRCYYQAEY